jgi:hypothetical protein
MWFVVAACAVCDVHVAFLAIQMRPVEVTQIFGCASRTRFVVRILAGDHYFFGPWSSDEVIWRAIYRRAVSNLEFYSQLFVSVVCIWSASSDW